MKRIVWKAGKKQAIAAACVLMGTALMACGADESEDVTKVNTVVNEIEEASSAVESVEARTEQQTVVEDSVVEDTKVDLNQVLEEGREELKKWSAGELAGVWGENSYTQTLLADVRDNGVSEYLTFAFEGKDIFDAAIVIAGEKTEDGIKGSVWHVVKDGSMNLLEQNVAFSGETLACIQNAKECAVFLNFSRNGMEEGRIIGFEDTTPWELLEDVAGVKNVLEDATVEVIAPVTTELGTATMRYHYELDDKKVKQLDTQILEGEQYLASVDVDKLPWAKEAFHASTISRESWDNPSIIGEEYTPEGIEAEILAGLLPDYSEKWNNWSEDYWSKWDSESCYYQIFQMQETPSFAVYGTHIDSRMIIETYDDSYVQIDGHFTSNYGVQPQVLEGDFDQDGSLELAITTLTKHGTGVYIEDIWMADKSDDDKWYVYELQADWPSQNLSQLFRTEYTEQGLELRVKDETVAIYTELPEEGSISYGLGNHIYYDLSDGKLMMKVMLGLYSDSFVMPIYCEDYLLVELGYHGDGEWSVSDYTYGRDVLE